jgi:hypothetical protein
METSRPTATSWNPWVERALEALRRQAEVACAELVGSRARGDATPLSDYDLRVDLVTGIDTPTCPSATEMFGQRPLAELWDPLARSVVKMFVLRGPTKVDVIFSVPNTPLPPWKPSAATLAAIDQHFWDWTLWLASKTLRGAEDVVAQELDRMQWFLLGPLGCTVAPRRLDDAVATYLALRADAERNYLVEVPRELGAEVVQALQQHGVLPTH